MNGRVCAALYVVLAVAITWPFLLVLGTHVPHDLGDPLLSTWAVWWNAQHVPFTAAWWNAPQFFPVHGGVAFSDHRVGLALITQPVQWAGGSPLAAANIALLLSFPLSAGAAHLLVHSLTGRHDAALVAGLVFGFNPYRIAHLEHLELVSSYWMPVALFALHRYVNTPRARWILLFCSAWLLQSLCSSYYLFYFSVLIGLWVLWFAPALGLRRTGALVASWIAAGVLLLPVLLAYRQIHTSLGLHRTRNEIVYFSADIAAIFSASPLLAFWRTWQLVDRPEGQLFPGAIGLALVAAALLLATRRPVERARLPRVLLIVAGLFGVIALTPMLFGPWKLDFAGVSASVSGFRKPLSVAVAFLSLYCVSHPRLRAAYRGKSVFAFYVIAAVALWVLSWGPEPKFLGHTVLYQAPYAWFMRLPPFDSGLRVPARFAMPGILALSIAAGLAFSRIVVFDRRGLRLAFVVLTAIGIAADGWIRELPLLTPPRAWTASVPAAAFESVLELPLVHGGAIDAAAVYRSMSHLHPTVNGFSGHFPPHYLPMRLGLERGEPEVLSTLTAWGPVLVAIHRQNDPDGGWVRYLSAHHDAVSAGTDGDWTFFLLSGRANRGQFTATGRDVPVVRISSNFTSASVAPLVDGDPITRWVTPTPQRGHEEVIIDTGDLHDVRGLVLSLGVFREDFPRRLAIDSSADGERWTTAWEGRTAGLTVAAALHDPHHTNLSLPIGATTRFVRLRQTESDTTYYWSIADVRVIGEAR